MKPWGRLIAFNNNLENLVRQARNDSGLSESDRIANRISTTMQMVVLIIDRSISMGWTDYPPSRLKAAVEACEQYVLALAERPVDAHVAVICFDDEARLVLPPTSIQHCRNIIRALRFIGVRGGTDIASGLKLTNRILTKHPVKNAQVQLILLTDGHGGNPVAASKKAKEKFDASIDVVGIGGTPRDVNESLLRRVASTDPDGYCHYHFIRDANALKQHYRRLATGLVWKGTDR